MKTTLFAFTYFLISSLAFSQNASKTYSVQAVNYFQTAAEVKALQIQAYNFAKVSLDLALVSLPASKPFAIVVDIDETLLDNSPYQARQILSGESYPNGWKEWVEEASAKAIPGSVEFLNYANDRHVAIFYVSNRKVAEIQATLKNLTAAGFPQVIESRMIFREKESSKEPRRKLISEKYTITLLIGDNLADFSEVFDRKSVSDRDKAVDNLKSEFGSRFIMLPNSLYGDWESAIYQWKSGATEDEKSEFRLKALKK